VSNEQKKGGFGGSVVVPLGHSREGQNLWRETLPGGESEQVKTSLGEKASDRDHRSRRVMGKRKEQARRLLGLRAARLKEVKRARFSAGLRIPTVGYILSGSWGAVENVGKKIVRRRTSSSIVDPGSCGLWEKDEIASFGFVATTPGNGK